VHVAAYAVTIRKGATACTQLFFALAECLLCAAVYLMHCSCDSRPCRQYILQPAAPVAGATSLLVLMRHGDAAAPGDAPFVARPRALDALLLGTLLLPCKNSRLQERVR
jgi:hypothetical protein